MHETDYRVTNPAQLESRPAHWARRPENDRAARLFAAARALRAAAEQERGEVESYNVRLDTPEPEVLPDEYTKADYVAAGLRPGQDAAWKNA